MIYSKEFEKDQWTKSEIYYLIKNKGKSAQQKKLSDIDRTTLQYIQETKIIQLSYIAVAIEENTLSELLRITRDTLHYSSWNLSRVLKIAFKPSMIDISKLRKTLSKARQMENKTYTCKPNGKMMDNSIVKNIIKDLKVIPKVKGN